MKKYKCECCGRCCYPEELEERYEIETTDAWAGPQYYGPIYICPECGNDELKELNIWNKACIEYDEEFGCAGDCDDCPLMTDTEEEKGND